MTYRNEMRHHVYRIFVICFIALAVFAVCTPGAGAYPTYDGCRACHGDFRASNYVSLMDGQSWGNLHDLHRTTMLGGDCNVCHSGASRTPVNIATSNGGTGLQAISCTGCHGRSQDAGHDDTSGGLGAGLRQHHTRAGETDCQGCHSDAVPANYTPVGENVKPPYYAKPGTGHANMPTDPCNTNPTATGKETFAGLLLGLDNDGNDLYDAADNACRRVQTRVDFDGDRMTDITVWRPSTGVWYILQSSLLYDPTQFKSLKWGDPTDVPMAGDYDGDGKTDYAVWRPSTGTWFILQSSDGYSQSLYKSYKWGDPTDIPVPGDYDGDGKTDVAVWRPSTGVWYVLKSAGGVLLPQTQWGMSTDTVVPGDYDGDGKTDYAVWRPSTGTWYILQSSNGFDNSKYKAYKWGESTDTPVPGDYDGDGKTDIAVWRPSTGLWYILFSSLGYNPAQFKAYKWGNPTDIPVPGDYDGNGKTDIAVWRPADGVWYVLSSSNGYNPAQFKAYKWGTQIDVPVLRFK